MSSINGGWVDGFLSSWSMILVSEIGDKTFFIACLMAMRYPKLIVFTGAIAALAAMTVLSALMGVIVPNVLSVRVTQGLAVVLFFVFGVKILYEAFKSGDGDESDDEMAEAAAALGKKEDDLETGSQHSVGSASSDRVSTQAKRWNRLLNPVLVQAFTLTFVAEWGDRSQLATIALAAAKNPYGVTLGGIVGHSICTGGAVMFGNLIAQKVSMKTVNIIGGALFIFFSLATLYELVTHSHHIEQAAAVTVATTLAPHRKL
jgi:putative Ca2+/H+ antiporter (TMEM165/GDT1 family)